ncbi:MAG: tRNA 2-thiouridine(34) synthase MnmA [Candidatus Aenigmatarchaeota archaeon]
MKQKVAVALSGGIDRSTAAHLLLQQGHEVKGFYLKLFKESNPTRAQLVAERLKIELEVVDFTKEFETVVINHFLSTYLSGATPNPCIICNPQIKFGQLFDVAKSQGFSTFATGHYARLVCDEHGKFHLLRALSSKKDQSYFLYGIPKYRLKNISFPMGDMTKDEAKKIVERENIPASSGESQDVCFLVGGNYREFLKQKVKDLPKEGEIVDVFGRHRGKHSGFFNYTVGQRHGLGIRARYPLYVVRIEAENNRIIVGRERDLYKDKIVVGDLNILEDVNESFTALVQIRASLAPELADVRIAGSKAFVDFKSPVRAPTPGQAAVFYKDDMVLGGGCIEKVE